MPSNTKALCGYDVPFTRDLLKDIEMVEHMGYSFMCMPLFHPRYRRDYSGKRLLDRKRPDTRSDTIIQELGDYSRFLIGRLSAWPAIESAIPAERRNAEAALHSELHWAAHLGLPAVLLQLRNAATANLARILSAFLKEERFPFQVWVQVPAWRRCAPGQLEVEEEEEAWEQTESSPWHWWTRFVTSAGHVSSHLHLVLELGEDLPPEWAARRWRAEMCKSMVVPTRLFLTNRAGFPVLPKAHQKFVQGFFVISDLQIVISGNSHHRDKSLSNYHQYILHIYATREPLSLYASHGKDFADTLQDPLQPLADNLQSSTYAVFEMDPYKYDAYQRAIKAALQDRIRDGVGGSNGEQVVMVLGAGRGPLVAAALAAGAELGLLPHKQGLLEPNLGGKQSVGLRVYAVEKNANAVITLRNRVLEEWCGYVQVFSGDMRHLVLPELADIFVSELLGSFGDNELSPECLDGAMRFLRADGISIPSEYTSYLAPLHSAKIHSEISNHREAGKPHHVAFETPFVVNVVMCDVLAEPQPLFRFQHPNWDVKPDNSRFGQLTFRIPHDATLHGFIGYFDSVLYKDIHMGIVPATHSPDMFSWFPLVFPLTNPVPLTGTRRDVTVSMWRRCRCNAVWYEWLLEHPVAQHIHNPAGRSYTIGL